MNDAQGIRPISAKKSITIAKHRCLEEDFPQCAIHTEKVTSFFNRDFFCISWYPTMRCRMPYFRIGYNNFWLVLMSTISYDANQMLWLLNKSSVVRINYAYLKHVPRVAGTNSSTALPTLSELSRNSKLTVKNSELDTWKGKIRPGYAPSCSAPY